MWLLKARASGSTLSAARSKPPLSKVAAALGRPEEESLQKVGAQLQRRHRLGLGLDPLGHHQRADPARKADQTLEGLLLVEVAVDAGDQAAIDLDDVGAQERDAIEVGVPGPHVVEDHQEAALAERRRQLAKSSDVIEARLQEFDADVARIEPGRADQRLQLGRQHRGLGHGGQIQVEEQQQLLGAGAQPVKVADRALAAEILDGAGDPFGGRLLEEGIGRDQIAAGSDAAGERLQARPRSCDERRRSAGSAWLPAALRPVNEVAREAPDPCAAASMTPCS